MTESFEDADEGEMMELTLECGAIYTGGIADGKPSGYGRLKTPMRLPGGETYLGQLDNGQPSGQGRITFANNFSFRGDFQADFAYSGVVTDPDNCPLQGYQADIPYFGYQPYSGFFVDGRREGHGVETWPDGRTYEGNICRDQFLYTDVNGKQFESHFDNGAEQRVGLAGESQLAAAAQRRCAAEQKRELMRLSGGIRANNAGHQRGLMQLQIKTKVQKQSAQSFIWEVFSRLVRASFHMMEVQK